MAAKEMYDYLSTISADSNVTLSVSPQRIVIEEGEFAQVVHEADDCSEERISFSSNPVFFVTLEWDNISAADAGTIMDVYLNTSSGYGTNLTFKWAHPTDGHTYVVRFAGKIVRNIRAAAVHGIASIMLKVLGRIADA